jgi:MerR family transcriptional regulator, light-induced transcriptional regulator
MRIGELSRRTGVRADTLRAWERRYGLLEPERSEGGFRLYRDADQRRVTAMRALVGSGTSAAEAARRVLSGAEQPPGPGPSAVGDLGRRLPDALQRFDEAEANAILDQAIAALSLEAITIRIVLPALAEIGDRWERGEASVAQEHFATNLIRGRLMGLARNWGAGSGPLAILACPPGELHDIGLLAFGLVLRARGWRIAYLGADAPIETVADAAERLGAGAVVLAAITSQPFTVGEPEIGRLARRTEVWLAGAGASEEIAGRVGANLLTGDPVSAAERLARGVAREGGPGTTA